MRGERMEERQRCGVPQLWRDAQGGCSADVVWCAAGQLECCCELRRAERELCWGEQRGEQRGAECERVWARAGREWRQRRRWCWRKRVRWKRVAQRQRACLPDCCWARQGRGCVGVCRSAAGQLECCCELRRAERELCWGEQRGEQRGAECERVWARAGREWRQRRRCAWGDRVRGQRLGQRQRCSVQSSHGRVWRSRGGCVCWSSARQLQRAVELRRAERELSRTEQRCEQRGCERDRCGAGRGGPERHKQQGATRLDCVRGKRVAE
jgi:hypothetical protein